MHWLNTFYTNPPWCVGEGVDGTAVVFEVGTFDVGDDNVVVVIVVVSGATVVLVVAVGVLGLLEVVPFPAKQIC